MFFTHFPHIPLEGNFLRFVDFLLYFHSLYDLLPWVLVLVVLVRTGKETIEMTHHSCEPLFTYQIVLDVHLSLVGILVLYTLELFAKIQSLTKIGKK